MALVFTGAIFCAESIDQAEMHALLLDAAREWLVLWSGIYCI